MGWVWLHPDLQRDLNRQVCYYAYGVLHYSLISDFLTSAGIG